MFLKLSKFFLYASVFSVVVVLSSTFFPFIGGKYYFFRTAIELALISLLLWWAFEARDGELEKRFAKILDKPIFLAVSEIQKQARAVLPHEPKIKCVEH